MARNDQIVRVLALAHAMATSKRGISLPAFAKQKGFPQRSVYNDRRTLEKAGFPIVEVARGRYRLNDTWRPIGQPNLDQDEALALFLARQLMGTMRVTSMGRALDRVWTKLSGAGAQAALVPSGAPWLSVRPAGGIDYAKHREVIAVFEKALRERRVVRCRYQRLGEDVGTARDVEPGELHWDPGLETLYLIGWCRLRAAVRVFAVHRFEAAEVLAEQRFEARAETRSAVALKNAFRVWRGETVERVKLRLWGAAGAGGGGAAVACVAAGRAGGEAGREGAGRRGDVRGRRSGGAGALADGIRGGCDGARASVAGGRSTEAACGGGGGGTRPGGSARASRASGRKVAGSWQEQPAD